MSNKSIFNLILISLASIMLIFTLVRVLSVDKKTKADPLISPPSSPFQNRIAGIGIIEPLGETIAIGTPVPGLVSHIFVHVRDRVKAGQPLFSLDEREIKAKLHQAQASLKTAQIQWKQAQSKLSFYQRITDRRAISEEEFSQVNFTAEAAAAKVGEAEAAIKLLETQRDLLKVCAPCDGEILKISIRVGEYATPNPADQPLMRLGQTQQLMVRVAIDETDIPRFNHAKPAVGMLRGNANIKIPLIFKRLEPYVMPKHATNNAATQLIDTRVVDILYALAADSNLNTDAILYSGQQMDVFIDAQ